MVCSGEALFPTLSPTKTTTPTYGRPQQLRHLLRFGVKTEPGEESTAVFRRGRASRVRGTNRHTLCGLETLGGGDKASAPLKGRGGVDRGDRVLLPADSLHGREAIVRGEILRVEGVRESGEGLLRTGDLGQDRHPLTPLSTRRTDHVTQMCILRHRISISFR